MVSSLIYVSLLQVLLCCQISCATDDHSFYVSICKVKTLDKKVEIDCRIFKNDLELGIRELLDDSDWTIAGSDAVEMVDSYFLSRFELFIDGVSRTIRKQQVVFEGEGPTESVSCVYSALYDEQLDRNKEWVIKSRLLTEVYDDQVNMIHAKVNGTRRSKNLDKDDPTFSFIP